MNAISPASRDALNFAWLLRLRWTAFGGQVLTILVAALVLGVRVAVLPLGVLVGLEVLSNLAAHAWAHRRPIRPIAIGAVMSLDILFLTGLLHFSGGSTNPFSFLFLVHIALAAVVLPPRWTWALVGLALVCLAALFADPSAYPLDAGAGPAAQLRLHVRGMWVASAVAAVFIVTFVGRIQATLARREADLRATREQAAHSERLAALTTLAAGAAHELATPLGTIAVVARELELDLARRPDSDPLREDVALIRAEVERCRAVLGQLSTDAAGAPGETLRPVPVRRCLEHALGDAVASGRVRLAVDPEVAERQVTVPALALAQSVRALVHNALEAAPESAPVEVRAEPRGDALAITIADRGPGMPREVLLRVGEPFFTTKPAGEGMGLGVFLARSVAEQLGGSLELDSAPGRGTTARLALPWQPATPTGGARA